MYSIIKIIVTAYCKKSHHKKKIGWIVSISLITTFLSSFALSIALAIMNGFQYTTAIKMQGIHSDITIDGYGAPLNEPLLTEVIKNEFPEIVAMSFYTTKQGLVTNKDSKSIPKTALFFGINKESYYKTHSLKNIMLETVSENDSNNEEGIIIGRSMGDILSLTLNNRIDCIFGSFDQDSLSNRIQFEHEELPIEGFFQTGIEEYDNNVIFIPLNLLKTICPEISVTQLDCHINKHKGVDLNILKKKLEKRLGLRVMSWHDYYPALVSAMNLENMICTIIFILISFMASLTNGVLLILYIYTKKKDIALFQLLGISSKIIQLIFIIYGIVINMIATFIGIIIALIFSYYATTYQLFSLPEAYYVNHVVFMLTPQTALFVIIISCLTTLFISIITTYWLNQIKIIDNLDVN